MKLRISLLIILMSMLFTSCGISTGKGTEQKEEEISVLRYDKLLSEYVRSNSFSAMQKLTMDYRMPTKILIEDVLSIGTVKDDTISQRLQKFYSDTTLVRLLSDVEAKYPNLDEVEKGLSKGFRKLKKEVPDTKVPFIYSQVSAFNESIILVDSLLGISLDKYMGEDYPLYKRFYYDYQCRSMRPERIVPDCFAFYLLSRYGMNYHEGTCLIDLMMHSGKINYVDRKQSKEQLIRQGSDGLCSVSYRETYVDGELTDTTETNRETVIEMVPTIIKHYDEQAPVSSFVGPEIVASPTAKGSSGRRLTYGTVAVNPNVIPYGSLMYITSADGRFVYGYAYAADTGTAMMTGNAFIDLYYETYSESVDNAVIAVNVYVLDSDTAAKYKEENDAILEADNTPGL